MKYIFTLFILSFVSINAQKPTQNIRGFLVDADLGSPLIGATVQLSSVSPILGAVTDQKGLFIIKNVPVGRHQVKISYIGYEDKVIANILLNSGKQNVLNIKMVEKAIQTGTVEVTAHKDRTLANNDMIVASVRNLRPEAINRYAGTRADPSKMAATTAGVAGDNNQRNDIVVRGNSPISVLWRIEDVEVPNPNHFTVAGTGGGVFAIINNNTLANCDFLTGAFPAEYGNKTGAAFDIKLRNGNSENFENTFQLGLNGLEFATEGPMGIGEKSSYLVNLRAVTLKPLKSLGFDLSVNTVPHYIDGVFKFNIMTEDFGMFDIWGLGGQSEAHVLNSEDVEDWSEDLWVEDENIISTMYAMGIANTHF